MAATVHEAFVLRCEDALTFASASDIRTRFASALDHNSQVVVTVPPTADIDITFIQILVSANKSAALSGKTLRVDAPASGGVFGVMTLAGLHDRDVPGRGEAPPAARLATHAPPLEKGLAAAGASASHGQDLDVSTLATLVKEIGVDGVGASLDIFLTEMQDRIAVLRRLSIDDNRAGIQREAHSVKGTAGIFGLRQLAEAGAELERNAASLDDQIYTAMLARLESAFEGAREALRTTPLLAA